MIYLGLACAALIIAAFWFMDQMLERRESEAQKAVVAELKANYQEALSLAKAHPQDMRINEIAMVLGRAYYHEALDDTMIIDPNNIESFVRKVCALDAKIDLPSVPHLSFPPQVKAMVTRKSA